MSRHVRSVALGLLGLLVALAGSVAPVTVAHAETSGSIAGQVVGGSEVRLLPGIEVRAYRHSEGAGWSVVAQTLTDGNGSYLLGA